MTPRFYAFWAINAALDQARLRRQLELFRTAGFNGVVWHPRFYPNKPPYLSDCYLVELSEVILHAKSLGLAFWIYDEDGWPSGTVGGQLLKKYPADAQRWAELVAEKPESCLAEFEKDGRKWFLAERIGHGVDYFNPDLARHFLELTHERYRTGLKPEAWKHVEAIFCDEPEFGLGHAYDLVSKHGAIPWTPQLPGLFRARHGEDLLPLIPQIFFSDRSAAEVCVKFWELLPDVFNESFTIPINDWCLKHGKRFTAHLKGEEHPFFQVPTNGSCHQFFRNLSLPAIDALERYPANNFSPRQVSSAARQFGDGRCMVEAFGGAGWGATPEDLERYLLWLGRNGLTDFVMHLSQYRLDSAAMHDWPPSQPLHLTWRDAYPEVLRRVRGELRKNPRPSADTLVIAPNRGIMAQYQPQEFLQTNVHNAATYPESIAGNINRRFMALVEELHRSGLNYDVIDERTLEQSGKVEGGILNIGRCHYHRVVVADGCRLNTMTTSAIQPIVFKPKHTVTETAVGSGIVFSGSIPVHWQLESQPINSLLLETTVLADGTFAARFESVGELGSVLLQLVFADDIASLALNNKTLPLEFLDEGSVAHVDVALISHANEIRFRATNPKVERPFVWLKGFFRISSSTPFLAGPNNTIKTEGSFIVSRVRTTLGPDLITDGFPFLQTGLMATAGIVLPEEVSKLRLDGVEADAVHLMVAGRDLGWAWRTNGEIAIPAMLPKGNHRVKIQLMPNTFNGFGPHHYYAGDWHVVSPDQIKGVRNFADAPGAPAKTHVAAWHFRPFKLPEGISFL